MARMLAFQARDESSILSTRTKNQQAHTEVGFLVATVPGTAKNRPRRRA